MANPFKRLFQVGVVAAGEALSAGLGAVSGLAGGLQAVVAPPVVRAVRVLGGEPGLPALPAPPAPVAPTYRFEPRGEVPGPTIGIPGAAPSHPALLGVTLDTHPLGEIVSTRHGRDHFGQDLGAALRELQKYQDHEKGRWRALAVRTVTLRWDSVEGEWYIDVEYSEEYPG